MKGVELTSSDVSADVSSRKRFDRLPATEHYISAREKTSSRWKRFKLWYQYQMGGFVLDTTPGFPAFLLARGKGRKSNGFMTSYDSFRLQYTFGGWLPAFNMDLTIWTHRQHHTNSILMALVSIATAAGWGASHDFATATAVLQMFASTLATLWSVASHPSRFSKRSVVTPDRRNALHSIVCIPFLLSTAHDPPHLPRVVVALSSWAGL
jgi:hypothetical protein